MSDITPNDINQQLGVEVFEHSESLTLNLSFLARGSSLTLDSEILEPLLQLLRTAREAAVDKQVGLNSYLPFSHEMTLDGELQCRTTMVALAQISERVTTLNTKPLTVAGRPVFISGRLLIV